MDPQHYTTTEWLVSIFDTLAAFRRANAGLVRACQPVVRRIVVDGPRLMVWLQSGLRNMALHRAQFLPLGPSAIMHRFVCPSPARDCLLIVRARGYLTRALNSYCIGQAGAQFRTQWPHSAFALEHDRRTDLTRILFVLEAAARPGSLLFRFTRSARSRSLCDRQMRLLCGGLGHVSPIRRSPAIASYHGRPMAIRCVAQGPMS